MQTNILVSDRKVSLPIAAARLGILAAAALIIPNLGMPQAITGVLVNALLLLTVEWAGLGTALVIGMLTPIAAVLRGVLPLPLLVMVPFIALGNATFVSIYNSLRQRNQAVAVVAGAVLKFALLAVVVTFLSSSPLKLAGAQGAQPVAMPAAMVTMMTWPQLLTALGGGMLAGVLTWTVKKIH